MSKEVEVEVKGKITAGSETVEITKQKVKVSTLRSGK